VADEQGQEDDTEGAPSSDAAEPAPDADVDESKMSPMELLRHRQAQEDWPDPDSEEERKRQEFLAEAELRLSSGRTPAQIEELLRRNRFKDD